MFRFIARRIPRFGLPTLIALMLLVVSVGGAARIGFGPDYEAAAALRSLENEGLGYVAGRPFSGETDAATLSTDAWNPFRRLAHWLMGHEDRVVVIGVSGWPSEEARKELFDLPDLVEISMEPPLAEGPSYGPERVPTPEEILGRSLPEFAKDVTLPAEAPPIPSGTPLSDEEREELFRELHEQAGASAVYQGERFVCRAESTDFPGFTLVTASDGTASWQLRYRQAGSKVSAKIDLNTPRDNVERVWDERWQTYAAFHDPEADRDIYVHPGIDTGFPFNSLLRAYQFDSEATDVYESVERLDDGTIALHLRPREIWSAPPPRGSVMLLEGVVIVDPQNGYAIRRFDAVEDNRIPGMKTSVRYAFEYEDVAGHHVPVRCFEWSDSPPRNYEQGVVPGGPHAAVTRYAWDFDPDLSPSLFEPPKEKGEFFAAAPPTGRFQWWYVTGAIAIGWLYFIVSRGVLRRFRRTKPQKGAHEESPIAAPRSVEA